MGEVIPLFRGQEEPEPTDEEKAHQELITRIEEAGHVLLGSQKGHAFVDAQGRILHLEALPQDTTLPDSRKKEIDEFYRDIGIEVRYLQDPSQSMVLSYIETLKTS